MVMLFIHFLLWECMPYFHNGVGLCQKSFLLEAGTLPTKYRGIHGTERVHVFHPQLTSSTQHSSLDHPWHCSLLHHSLCAVASSATGWKRKRKLWWFCSFQPWLHGGLGCCLFCCGQTVLRWKVDMCLTNHSSAGVVLISQLQIKGKQQAGSQGWGLPSQEGAIRWTTYTFIL